MRMVVISGPPPRINCARPTRREARRGWMRRLINGRANLSKTNQPYDEHALNRSIQCRCVLHLCMRAAAEPLAAINLIERNPSSDRCNSPCPPPKYRQQPPRAVDRRASPTRPRKINTLPTTSQSILDRAAHPTAGAATQPASQPPATSHGRRHRARALALPLQVRD